MRDGYSDTIKPNRAEAVDRQSPLVSTCTVALGVLVFAVVALVAVGRNRASDAPVVR